MASSQTRWLVLKFGGTSVSTRANWEQIATIVQQRLATGAHLLIVHSALSGVTDLLEQLISAAVSDDDAQQLLIRIRERHDQLARDLEVPVPATFESLFAALESAVNAIRIAGECDDFARAAILACGELLATTLGTQFLRQRGFDAVWADARNLLRSEQHGAHARADVLAAACGFEPDAQFAANLATNGQLVVTQGFIAGDHSGNTVLLGRGGSDTSAAYLAARLAAMRLEIWTDVPGMFSANPRAIPGARLLRSLDYDEAQEIATAGAKVLHPRCILPVKKFGIELHVYSTVDPAMAGTVVSASGGGLAAQVKAVCLRKGVTLVTMDSPGMWHQVGFLADVFAVFKQHGLSVDLVSTSETNVTVSLDPAANTLDRALLDRLIADLEPMCGAEIIGPCSSVTLVGRNIRAILHQLGDALELFEEQKVYLVTQAANDLNLTFVVDEGQGDRLVKQLHERLVRPTKGDLVWGPTWQQLSAATPDEGQRELPWWHKHREQILAAATQHGAAFIYDLSSIADAAHRLRSIKSVGRFLYAMKANWHPAILQTLYNCGIDIECVSRGELEHAFDCIPDLDPQRVLFTPNFCAREEYARAMSYGVLITLDNQFPLTEWPDLFRNREIMVRVDPGFSQGHHAHVRTGGSRSKFGVAIAELTKLASLCDDNSTRVVGLHAHSGSGNLDIDNWAHLAELLAGLAGNFPAARFLDLGGGLGVPEQQGSAVLDVQALDAALARLVAQHPRLQLWLEPGRYLVSQAGVLVAAATQLKSKSGVDFVGLATGMNSLIRPALYGAHHEIFNLTRIAEPATRLYDVVGPICESADFAGHDRLLPQTQAGDILLICNAGAYGRAMSSHYNLRNPAVEIVV
ncbi:MAG: bifunctional aspartate kinase/diaminopimelate decarboxylase [Steroidobacteraceae bacterium]